ncbi:MULTISPECIES: hypothetical protein [Streptomyces]|uniref:hypothetical protein n=1 Tax=Streptomyces TaxID=1883 RepID=UPI001E429123|nr:MULTISPECIES: hypothetical protein [Streptomyces]UFQ16383.1 hypothetical protein J2N69_16010 [Streptomyces huasconensis]WCL85986.1 hypothetical protein PPN52_16020 [Streptomyces sp. JCM 35825]
MTEDNNAFDELVSNIETEFNQALIEKRGSITLMLARIAGTIYTEAVSHGVPHSLAQDMAQDYWIKEMHPGVVVLEEGEGDADH